MPITENKLFRINVSKDKLTATIAVNGDAPPAAMEAEDICQQVRALGIQVDDKSKENIEAFASQLNGETLPEAVIVAQGTPPVHDKNGKIEKVFLQNIDETEDNVSSKSHYDRSDIITVNDGDELLRFIAPVPGNDGTDIYGKPVPHKLGREAQIRLGTNVKREGDIVYATSNGKVECTSEKVWIDSKLVINTNVDFSVGNINFDGDVEIQKNVLDLFKITSKSTVTVNGVIEAAEIHANLDINGNGGMAGKEKGSLYAGRDINAKYITNATAFAKRNINIATEIVNSDVVCEGMITIENGPLVGGKTVATGGMKLKDLGSDAGVKTIVEVGIDEHLKEKFNEVEPEIKLKRHKAQKVRQVVEPLMANQKHLNNEQKEKATELLYQASELEDDCNRLIKDLQEAYDQAQEKAITEIEVLGKVFSGVTIRFPRVEAIVTREMKGPLKIHPQKLKGLYRVFAVDQASGTSKALDAGSTLDPFWEKLEELLNPETKTNKAG